MTNYSTATMYRITFSYAVYGVFVDEHGTIVEAAPIAHWALGKTIWYFDRWVRSKGGSISVV